MSASYLAKARHYFDWWKLTGRADYLSAASQFLLDYEKSGGTEGADLRRAVDAAVAAAVPAPVPQGVGAFVGGGLSIEAARTHLEQRNRETCFGRPWSEIESMQGGRLT